LRPCGKWLAFSSVGRDRYSGYPAHSAPPLCTLLVKPWHENEAEWGFNEWLHAQTGQPSGRDGRPGRPLCISTLPSVCSSRTPRSSARCAQSIRAQRGSLPLGDVWTGGFPESAAKTCLEVGSTGCAGKREIFGVCRFRARSSNLRAYGITLPTSIYCSRSGRGCSTGNEKINRSIQRGTRFGRMAWSG